MAFYTTTFTSDSSKWDWVEVTSFGDRRTQHLDYWPSKYPSADPPLRGERKLVKLYGIDMDRTEAKRQLDLYSALPEVELTAHERELMALYDAIASEKGQVIDLDAIWNSSDSRDRLQRLPQVAVVPIKAAEVTVTLKIVRDRESTNRNRRIHLSTFSAPGWQWQSPGTYFNVRSHDYVIGMAVAKVPSVSPLHRDKVEDGDLLLWEPTWTKTRLDQHRRPDPDPAILRHVTGSLYRVIAAWDLTPVEMKILGR